MLIQWSKLPENAVSDEPDPTPFSQDWADDYIQKVYNGTITKEALDPRYHEIVGTYLMRGAQRGFKGAPSHFTEETLEHLTIKDIRRNIFQFSAAKQYQQVVTMSEFIYENGMKSNFSEFKKLADNVFKAYNKNYLKAEFTTAVGQAQSARDWIYFETHKAQFPYLRYHTQLDDHVRAEHAALEGITRKVDDPFWRYYGPKNGWRCRCFLTAHETGRSTDLDKREIPEWGSAEYPSVFKMNPGIDRLVFDPQTHPYFFVEKGDAALKKANFNLPLP